MNNKMRLAFSTKLFSDLPLSQRYAKIASIGVRNVCLHIEDGMEDDEIISAYKDFKQLGLSLVQISSANFSKSYVDEKHYTESIDEVKRLIKLQNVYGNAPITLSAGSYRGKKEEHIEFALNFIKEACDLAGNQDVPIALDFKPKKNQLLKTWTEVKEFYEKADKSNLFLNINTAVLHHLSTTDEDLEFIKGKAILLNLQDIEDKNWHVKINLGEGIADIKEWIKKTRNIVEDTCANSGFIPAALVMFHDCDEAEISRTLRYLESIATRLHM